MQHLVAAARPGVALRRVPSALADEAVLVGGGEVFRLPLEPSASAGHAVLVRALPRLRVLVPVAVPQPRYVGVLDDGETPFTAERRLPGVRPSALGSIAAGQLEGVVAALLAVPAREARQWGVQEWGAQEWGVQREGVSGAGPGAPGLGVLLHGQLGLDALLADARTGVLTGVVGWQPRLGDEGDVLEADLAALL